MKKISYIKSDDRKYNIERCLSLIKSEITSGLKNARSIVIKPNCVSSKVKLAATHVDALEALLEFIYPHIKGQITLAEGTGLGDTIEAFKNFGYLKLQDKYGFSLCDLNTDDYEEIELEDNISGKWKAKIAKTLLQSDYLISISPPKTHNCVVYTGAIKNVAIGSLIREDASFASKILQKTSQLFGKKNYKEEVHKYPEKLSKNIDLIYDKIPLKLAILDGFEAMEGNGPVNGDIVPAHFALASSDPPAADWLALKLMGIDIKKVEYIDSLVGNDDANYFIVGDDWQKNITPFRLHD